MHGERYRESLKNNQNFIFSTFWTEKRNDLTMAETIVLTKYSTCSPALPSLPGIRLGPCDYFWSMGCEQKWHVSHFWSKVLKSGCKFSMLSSLPWNWGVKMEEVWIPESPHGREMPWLIPDLHIWKNKHLLYYLYPQQSLA